MRTSLADLARMKASGARIAVITAYDVTSAQIAERAGVPVLLVGDSLGMVVLGHDTTLPVTVDDMVRHAGAVVRGSEQALVIADLPFLTNASEEACVAAAGRLMQEAGVQAVKIEGGAFVAPLVRKLVQIGIPVMGHLGFTPQSQHQLGLRVQGKDVAGARRLLADALALEEAGAFSIVLELVPAELARAVSERLRIPTIGIGAGAGCDGQVQVWHDLFGLFGGKSPRHAKVFAEISDLMEEGLRRYVAEVSDGDFPTDAQSSKMDAAILAEALDGE
jgi:3-methyl-2-oxobutanoate hydroxymethyltransferase